MKLQLDALPVELLDLIAPKLSRQDLLSTASTCRRLFDVAEPHLYRSVAIKDARGQRSFLESICTDSKRAALVRSLIIKRGNDKYRARHNAKTTSEPSDISVLAALSKLAHLSIESYYLDPDEFRHLFRCAARGEILCELKTCRLLFWNEEDTDSSMLSNFDAILLHPTLDVLTIYNARDGCSPDVYQQKSTSALRRLELLHSDFSVQELARLLAIPRGLKQLVVHVKPYQGMLQCCPYDWSEYARALEVAKDSLETLVITKDASISNRPLQLKNMKALRCIAADSDILFGQLRSTPEMVDERFLTNLLPPSLETIHELSWAFPLSTTLDDEAWTHALYRALTMMRRIAPALRVELRNPYGVSEAFKHACKASGVPIVYSYSDDDVEDSPRTGWLQKAPFLSLPVGPID
ncbi:f-box domain cyclin-like protein [Neofusicoccum parvum]|nr:f-box domain cyclin-like protein [Neofusicoccum parvum]